MKHRSKRLLSILLALVMALGLMQGMSLTALAEEQQATLTKQSYWGYDEWGDWTEIQYVQSSDPTISYINTSQTGCRTGRAIWARFRRSS